jgi:uncharacterized Zn finger protein
MASVADLVEPERLRERAGEYLQRAGEVLLAAGAVQLVDFEPMRVTAQVQDGGERHVAELSATTDGLAIRCDCPGGAGGGWCPHTVATAIETWHSAPNRQT